MAEKNVRVKLRLSALVTELGYKGNLQTRGPRSKAQQKVVVDFPIQEYTDLYEYAERIAALTRVVNRGWLLDADPPCEVWMGTVTIDPVTAIATFQAKVRSNSAATTVIWWIDIDPNWDNVVLQAANESPVTSADDELVSGTYDFSAFRGHTFYIQCEADDGSKTMYSVIRQIEIPTL
jgi:hypothetical protein